MQGLKTGGRQQGIRFSVLIHIKQNIIKTISLDISVTYISYKFL